MKTHRIGGSYDTIDAHVNGKLRQFLDGMGRGGQGALVQGIRVQGSGFKDQGAGSRIKKEKEWEFKIQGSGFGAGSKT